MKWSTFQTQSYVTPRKKAYRVEILRGFLALFVVRDEGVGDRLVDGILQPPLTRLLPHSEPFC